jgi:pSer/pThr/pTyr-binding forkhead associated (FHA) protein
MSGRLCIHVPDQPALLRVIEAPADMTIGRSDECDLVVDHHSVSRRHARLQCDASGQCRIDDLASKNGLRVDGQRVATARLDRAVWFAIGDVFCEYLPIQPEEVARMATRAQTLRDSSMQLAVALEQQSDTDKLLRDLLTAILQLSECRRGFVLLTSPGGRLRVRAWQAIDPLEIAAREFSGSRSAIERTLTERRAVYLSDARDASFLRHQASVIGQGIRALASLPLMHRGDLLGVVYVDTDDAAKVFTELDGELLQAFAARAATVLAAAQLDAELQRIEQRLEALPAASIAERIAAAGRSAGAVP